LRLPAREQEQLELFGPEQLVQAPRAHFALIWHILSAILLSGTTTACSSIPFCNLHWEDGKVVLDQCAGQDQTPSKGETDEKPATYDPEKPLE
jgi:hypothetical protein